MGKGFALNTQYCAKNVFWTEIVQLFLIDVKEEGIKISICIFAY